MKKQENNKEFIGHNITRKEALKKVTALTAATLFFLESNAQPKDSKGNPAPPPTR